MREQKRLLKGFVTSDDEINPILALIKVKITPGTWPEDELQPPRTLRNHGYYYRPKTNTRLDNPEKRECDLSTDGMRPLKSSRTSVAKAAMQEDELECEDSEEDNDSTTNETGNNSTNVAESLDEYAADTDRDKDPLLA